MKLSVKEIKNFQKTVWSYYKTSARTDLPWRKKINTYRIWVSEIMLQQTQVDRVRGFFDTWIKQFPTVVKLANASQIDILHLWKGLGYNSRALRMKKCAQEIMQHHQGKFPKSQDELQKLPGIGPYTAGAISAFANNQPVAIIETNIRRVFIHHFFADANDIRDEDILKLVEQTLDQKNPQQWYWALMDYGSFLGRTLNTKGKKYNPNVQSKHYTKQSTFKGSDRQIRGKILDVLLQEKKQVIMKKLFQSLQDLSTDNLRIKSIIDQLIKENFIEIKNQKIWLKK